MICVKMCKLSNQFVPFVKKHNSNDMFTFCTNGRFKMKYLKFMHDFNNINMIVLSIKKFSITLKGQQQKILL